MARTKATARKSSGGKRLSPRQEWELAKREKEAAAAQAAARAAAGEARVAKKRKARDERLSRAAAESSESEVAPPPDDAAAQTHALVRKTMRLEHTLRTVRPEELVAQLSAAISGGDAAAAVAVQALSKLLPKVLFPPAEVRLPRAPRGKGCKRSRFPMRAQPPQLAVCKRCKKPFDLDPGYSFRGECCIEHDFDESHSKCSSSPITMRCRRCYDHVECDEDCRPLITPSSFCFLGMHTTSRRRVSCCACMRARADAPRDPQRGEARPARGEATRPLVWRG